MVWPDTRLLIELVKFIGHSGTIVGVPLLSLCMAVGLFWFDIRSRFIWLGLQMPRRHEYKFVLFQSIQFFIHGPWCQYTVFVQILPHLFNNNKVLFVFQWCFGSALFHLDTTSECTHPYFVLDTTSGCTHQYFECFDILVKIAYDNWWQHSAHYEGSIVVELGLDLLSYV